MHCAICALEQYAGFSQIRAQMITGLSLMVSVHTSRSNKTSSLNAVVPVGSTLPIPHRTEYSASLCIKRTQARPN